MDDIEKLVLEKIDGMKDEIVKFHQEIIRLPSENPPSKYKEISEFIEKTIEKIGLKAQVKRNNVIGELGEGNGQTLIFNAHYDTIETFKGWNKNPFEGKRMENKIYGRGASDDKSCISAEIFAAKALIDAGIKIKGKLIITAVVDEELGGLGGTEYLLDRGIINGDACIVGDAPAEYPTSCIGGAIFISFTINGKQAHGFMFPDLPVPHRNQYSGISAIHKMTKIMDFLLKLQQELLKTETNYPVHPESPSKTTSINLAMIEGGTKISTVANKCLLHVSIQTIPEHKVEDIKNRILNFIGTLKKEDPDLDISVQVPISYDSFVVDINSKFASIVKNATKTVYGQEKEFKLFTCTTDAHWFLEKKIPTILIGTFRGENVIHCADENVYIEDLINTTKMFAITALNYLK